MYFWYSIIDNLGFLSFILFLVGIFMLYKQNMQLKAELEKQKIQFKIELEKQKYQEEEIQKQNMRKALQLMETNRKRDAQNFQRQLQTFQSQNHSFSQRDQLLYGLDATNSILDIVNKGLIGAFIGSKLYNELRK